MIASSFIPLALSSPRLALVETRAAEDDPHGAPQDTRVERGRAGLYVIEVELDALAPGQGGASVDLRPTGDPGPDREPPALALGVLGDLRRDRWARADERHLTA